MKLQGKRYYGYKKGKFGRIRVWYPLPELLHLCYPLPTSINQDWLRLGDKYVSVITRYIILLLSISTVEMKAPHQSVELWRADWNASTSLLVLSSTLHFNFFILWLCWQIYFDFKAVLSLSQSFHRLFVGTAEFPFLLRRMWWVL